MEYHSGMARPTKYTPELAQVVLDAMASGHSVAGAAGKAKVCRRTVYQWAEDIPEFSHVLNAARAASAAWWEQRAIDIAGGDDGNAAVTIFALKNRVADEWRDRQEIDHASSDGTMSPPSRIELVAPDVNGSDTATS